MKKIFFIVLFIFAFLFYWQTGNRIQNRTEAEDVYEYALMVEEGASHNWYYHKHHLMYGSFMRAAYTGAQQLGYTGRAIDIMRIISALAATASLFYFFLFCYRRYSLRPFSSLLASIFIGSCYGFWRYAAESEIPVLASFFVLAALYYSIDTNRKKYPSLVGMMFSIVAVLIHIMNVVAVFLVIPCFYLLKRRVVHIGLHVGVCGLSILLIYFLTGSMSNDSHSLIRTSFTFEIGSLLKGLVAFCQCIISFDFLLGLSSVRAFLNELFANRMLLEEFYYGERVSSSHILLSAFSLIGFLITLVISVSRAFWVICKRREKGGLYSSDEKLILMMMACFFLGYALLLLFIEPGNPELWVMGMIPFALLFCGLVLLPLTHDNRMWIPFLMIICLLFHNGSAITLLKNSDLDYQFNKAETILSEANEQDLILTAGNPVFERYLRYHSPANIIYLYEADLELVENKIQAHQKGKIFVLGDVFDQPKSLAVRFPDKYSQVEIFAEKIKVNVDRIKETQFKNVYEYKRGRFL